VQSRDCGIQFQQLQGGNTNLQPEKSDAWTVGFVLQPTPTVSFGIDYWNYVVTDNLGVLGETTIFGDTAKYANLFVRCGSAPANFTGTIPGCQNSPGRDGLAYIVNTQQNLGDTKTSGLDFSFNFNTRPESWGALSLGIRSTYILNYEFQVEPNGQWYNPVGNFNAQFGGPVLRYQQITTFGWSMGAWSALLSNRYQSGYFDQNPASSVAAGFRQNTVGAWSIWNLAATWSGWKGLTLQAGILNLFNTEPPYSNQTLRFQARAYDDRFASPLGRTWQLAARYEFK
jgi:iron complex outermembrane receptor protein